MNFCANQQELIMNIKYTRTRAFEYFGTTPTNPRWSRSAQSADGNTVVFSLWQHKFKDRDGRIYEDSMTHDDHHGGRALRRHLKWAWENCDGRVRVIVNIAKDPTVHPHSIKECRPVEMIMRLTHFDLETGTFAAEAEVELPELLRAA
jgi:hypothetical protein